MLVKQESADLNHYHIPCDESYFGVSAMQVINAIAVVFVWFVMVETKQRSLAQIQTQLVGSS
jgi:hypothetical protein